jgi:hypothetical protein
MCLGKTADGCCAITVPEDAKHRENHGMIGNKGELEICPQRA